MGSFSHNLQMLDGTETAGDDGPVRLMQGMVDPTLHVEGIVSGDEVAVWVSNDKEAPSNWIQEGANITSDGITDLTEGYRWIKCELDADAGGGTVTARLAAQEYC